MIQNEGINNDNQNDENLGSERKIAKLGKNLNQK